MCPNQTKMVNTDTIIFNVCVFISGLVLLERGADLFIDQAAALAKRLGVPEVVIALLTAGAEWEELAVVVASAVQRRPGLAFGNVFGSCISNILGAFSLGQLLFQPGVVHFDRSSKLYTVINFLVTTVVSILSLTGHLQKPEGIILIITFVLYVALVCWSIYRGMLAPPEDSDSDSDTDSNSSGQSTAVTADGDARAEDGDHVNESSPLFGSKKRQSPSTLSHVVKLITGFIALSVSGYLLSHSSKTLAEGFHISETAFGATLLSLATTLPEKFIAILSGFRGREGIVVANTVGSNIFLLTLCLGVAILSFDGVDGRASYFHEVGWMWASSAGLTLVILLGSHRMLGVVSLAAYVAFLVLEFTVYRA